jgi:nucleoside-diphosphate-sugar epimerase
MSSPNKPTVLVTGAGGFVGGRVVELLHLTEGFKVRPAVHRWSNAVRVGRFPVDIRQIDVLDEDTLYDAIEGVDYVIHCAHGGKEVNIKGTENVLRVSKKKNVKQVIYTSSVEVYDTEDMIISERSSKGTTGNIYGDSKLIAERKCREYESDEFPVTILRPTIIYGPFGTNWSEGIAKKILDGPITSDPYFSGYVRPIYVDDVVKSIIQSIGNKNAFNEDFNIGGPEKLTWSKFFDEFSSYLLCQSTSQSSGGFVLSFLQSTAVYPLREMGKKAMNNYESTTRKATTHFRFLKVVARYSRDLIETTPSFQELRLFRNTRDYNTDKSKRLLGLDPSITASEGLKMTSLWLKKYRNIK